MLDISICELYGMSECTGPATTNLPLLNAYQFGTVGKPLPGVELKIFHDKSRDKQNEGEICYRGRHIMMG